MHTELARVFCLCGREIEDDESSDPCPMCQGLHRKIYDAQTDTYKKPSKPHDDTCECESCEAGQDPDELYLGLNDQ